MLFKQLLAAEAIDVCQIDSCRLAGINEILAVLLMSAKKGVIVCPHAGGVGLTNYVVHCASRFPPSLAGLLNLRRARSSAHDAGSRSQCPSSTTSASRAPRSATFSSASASLFSSHLDSELELTLLFCTRTGTSRTCTSTLSTRLRSTSGASTTCAPLPLARPSLAPPRTDPRRPRPSSLRPQVPLDPTEGYSIGMHAESKATYVYPHGKYWSTAGQDKVKANATA